MSEHGKLDSIAPKYNSAALLGLNELYHLEMRDAIIPAKSNRSALEIGCGAGSWTPVLCSRYQTVDVVDGSQKLLEELAKNITADNLALHHCLIEELSLAPGQSWDHVFMTFFMEHLFDPVETLCRIKPFIKKGGSLFIAVPNANSLHRVIAHRMGLISRADELSANDHDVGHHRVYTRDLLIQHMSLAGFSVAQEWSIGLKPFTLGQMENLPTPVGAELARCGDLAPEYCAYLGLRAEIVRS
jgi:ubiquinone/menaquinone biosynthesis C-methylase UbiE